jgi:uncharacterized protein YndB with AHSA1/START domain
MSTVPPNPDNRPDQESVVSREYDAPRELAWEAMTNPKHIANWWGPRGFTTVTEVMDVRPGGEWKHLMIGPDGTRYPNHSVFHEVLKPERIVYSHGGHREGGPGVRFLSTWTFEALGPTRCRVTIRMTFATPEERAFVVKEFGALEGAKETLGRLAEHLATVRPSP